MAGWYKANAVTHGAGATSVPGVESFSIDRSFNQNGIGGGTDGKILDTAHLVDRGQESVSLRFRDEATAINALPTNATTMVIHAKDAAASSITITCNKPAFTRVGINSAQAAQGADVVALLASSDGSTSAIAVT